MFASVFDLKEFIFDVLLILLLLVHFSTRRKRPWGQRLTRGNACSGKNSDLGLQLHRGRNHGLRTGKSD
jgi:hypothetical protein